MASTQSSRAPPHYLLVDVCCSRRPVALTLNYSSTASSLSLSLPACLPRTQLTARPPRPCSCVPPISSISLSLNIHARSLALPYLCIYTYRTNSIDNNYTVERRTGRSTYTRAFAWPTADLSQSPPHEHSHYTPIPHRPGVVQSSAKRWRISRKCVRRLAVCVQPIAVYVFGQFQCNHRSPSWTSLQSVVLLFKKFTTRELCLVLLEENASDDHV